MIIYEVNLTIALPVFEPYCQWLKGHVQHMLQLEGFQSARFLFEILSEESSKKLTVQYDVDSLENLEQYFKHHAEKMREEGREKFPNQFSITRRIFEVGPEFSNDHPDDYVELNAYDETWPTQALKEIALIHEKWVFPYIRGKSAMSVFTGFVSPAPPTPLECLSMLISTV